MVTDQKGVSGASKATKAAALQGQGEPHPVRIGQQCRVIRPQVIVRRHQALARVEKVAQTVERQRLLLLRRVGKEGGM